MARGVTCQERRYRMGWLFRVGCEEAAQELCVATQSSVRHTRGLYVHRRGDCGCDALCWGRVGPRLFHVDVCLCKALCEVSLGPSSVLGCMCGADGSSCCPCGQTRGVPCLHCLGPGDSVRAGVGLGYVVGASKDRMATPQNPP